MRLLKRPLRDRLRSLEEYLGVAFSIDRWNDPNHIDGEYSTLKGYERRIKRLEKKVLTDKERKSRYDD